MIEADEKTSYLVSMPTKFRKNVWIKRGDYCIVEPIEEGDKVKAEIVRILYKVRIIRGFFMIFRLFKNLQLYRKSLNSTDLISTVFTNERFPIST